MLRGDFSNLPALGGRGPLRIMFIHTELVVGGAETLLVEIIRKLDRTRFAPELCCLKGLAELGEVLAAEIPTHSGLLRSKFDIGVIRRLGNLLKEREMDAVVTVGTGGDRMFWGRLAAWYAGIPVVLSALHSTGYPVTVEPINKLLAPITDGFIGCASAHSKYLASGEGCPPQKVYTVWNGVDVDRFQPGDAAEIRKRIGLPIDAPVAGIVAALRPEKQHVLLLDAWANVLNRIPKAQLVIVGDGIEREKIEQRALELGVTQNVHMLGTRHDVHEILTAFDVKILASRMEANPASTLEANACGVPAIAPNVGSLPDTIQDGVTGLLTPPNDPEALSIAIQKMLGNLGTAKKMGQAALKTVRQRFSVEVMVAGYESLIEGLYQAAQNPNFNYTPEDHDAAMDSRIAAISERRKQASSLAPAYTCLSADQTTSLLPNQLG
ncbi:MAG: glycosyltransferase [Aureliella sp.]